MRATYSKALMIVLRKYRYYQSRRVRIPLNFAPVRCLRIMLSDGLCSLLPGSAFRYSGDLTNKFHLFRVVRGTICTENLVEPDGRLAVCIGFLPGIPRQECLCLSRHQPPVVCGYFIFLCNWHAALERTSVASRHVLGTENRPIEALQPFDPLFKFRGIV